ncbi:ubiquitin carboxyl-terminal hydrolase 25-like isoform X1 [Equus przewalskii]|uniref:Ubiquitin carboxyl-terminal hydrolase 25-like isoform X1 n=1 Tax=Equus przewalskii TaxID=9798 RepID=A0ABM4JVK7_EQUPR
MPTRTRCATIEQSKNGSKDKRDLDVIDLTGDDEDDLQRAIALSLAESNRAFRETGMTDEEQAISRVLEASIAENKACLKRTPTEVWRDSRNPYDRKRQDKAPVGLKNVGNTCWFSAVIQSLFNLLEFRRLVLNYKASITCSRFTPKPKERKEEFSPPQKQKKLPKQELKFPGRWVQQRNYIDTQHLTQATLLNSSECGALSRRSSVVATGHANH